MAVRHARRQPPAPKREQAMPDRQALSVSDSVADWRWMTGSGRPADSWSAVVSELSRMVRSSEKQRVEVHVGCDSSVQPNGVVIFATVVCVIREGHAGRYYYCRNAEKRTMYPVLQTRLLREVQLSLETAEELKAQGVEVEQVHCDSNTDPTCKSTEHTRMLIGYIQSMGYNYLVKPDAWATFVADRHSRSVAHPHAKRLAYQA